MDSGGFHSLFLLVYGVCLILMPPNTVFEVFANYGVKPIKVCAMTRNLQLEITNKWTDIY